MNTQAIAQLETYDHSSGDLNVVIETPQGSRNKFKYVAGQEVDAAGPAWSEASGETGEGARKELGTAATAKNVKCIVRKVT